MRAAIARKYGPPEDLVVEEVADLQSGKGEVVVDVVSAAVNFPDLLIMSGGYQVSWPMPMVPGSEFAGRVREVGEGVTKVEVGDLVYGSVAVGAFAEQVVVPAGGLWKLPEGTDLAEAAAFKVTYLTAYDSLRTVAQVKPGDWVVVLGAGGGVGVAAVDIAKLLGARVVAAASSEAKLAVCTARGADAVINYSKENLKERIKEITAGGADVVIDPVGGPYAEEAIRASRWGSRYVCIGFASAEIPRIPMNLVLLKGVTIKGFEMRTFAEHDSENARRDQDELYEHFVAGRLRPHIHQRFALDDVVAAMQAVQNREVIGKIVIDMTKPRIV
ncbi:NADPH:quinone oxidoreductase family protein [Jatrophihabitans sp. DSM 45814]